MEDFSCEYEVNIKTLPDVVAYFEIIILQQNIHDQQLKLQRLQIVLLSFLCERRIKLVFRYFQLKNIINGKCICTELRAVLMDGDCLLYIKKIPCGYLMLPVIRKTKLYHDYKSMGYIPASERLEWRKLYPSR